MSLLTKGPTNVTFTRNQERPMQHIVSCPQRTCTLPAQIVDRWVWASSAGPVEHVKTWCANGHWFTPTLDTLTIQPTPSLPPEPVASVTVG
jgi:hypothetical protein